MTTVFLNGRFLGDTEDSDAGLPAALVSAFDSGFQHGVGLFETMTGGVTNDGSSDAAPPAPWVLHMDRHLDRLVQSARSLGLSADLRAPALGEAVLETVRRSALPRARIRLTITGGSLNMLPRGGVTGAGADPTILIVAQPATNYPDAMFERGVSVALADTRANPLNPFEGHKTLNYWWRLRELQAAAAKGAAEAIVLSVTNHLVGGCVSNLFLVNDGALLTPIARGEEGSLGGPALRAGRTSTHAPESSEIPSAHLNDPTSSSPSRGRYLPSPTLPGITRQWVIEHAERSGMECRRQMLSVADLLEADEVFLTNSSWGVLPIVKIEANAVGDAVPGRVTVALRERWATAAP